MAKPLEANDSTRAASDFEQALQVEPENLEITGICSSAIRELRNEANKYSVFNKR